MSLFIRKLNDTLPIKIITPISFALRGLILFSLSGVTNPTSFHSYFIWSLITFEGLIVGIIIDGYFAKNLPKEIRGVLISFMTFSGLVGKAIAVKIGGILYDSIGRNAPFIMIGICDLIFTVFIMIMIKINFYGNLKKEDIL